VDYQGQLLGEEDQSLANREVIAVASLAADHDSSEPFPRDIEVQRVSAKTDDQGNYTLHGLPGDVQVSLHVARADSSRESEYLGKILLEPNDVRPRAVSRLVKRKAANDIPLAQRYQQTLRDCAACGFCPLLILANGGDPIGEFVNDNFVDYQRNGDIYDFVQVTVVQGDKPLDAADAMFLKEHGWQIPDKGRIVAYALDSSGAELGKLDLEARDRSAVAAAAEFIHRHAPERHDAEQTWAEAFAEAKRSNRRVWARVSQRYCGPCFRLARWLDEERELLAKDYVMLKIDDFRDLHGAEVARRLTGGKHHGVPFFVIFGEEGVPLADSVAGPLGNIGHPDGIEGKRHLRKMLSTTRKSLTDAEVDQLVESLRD
jgi:hypothetical protein